MRHENTIRSPMTDWVFRDGPYNDRCDLTFCGRLEQIPRVQPTPRLDVLTFVGSLAGSGVHKDLESSLGKRRVSTHDKVLVSGTYMRGGNVSTYRTVYILLLTFNFLFVWHKSHF